MRIALWLVQLVLQVPPALQGLQAQPVQTEVMGQPALPVQLDLQAQQVQTAPLQVLLDQLDLQVPLALLVVTETTDRLARQDLLDLQAQQVRTVPSLVQLGLQALPDLQVLQAAQVLPAQPVTRLVVVHSRVQ